MRIIQAERGAGFARADVGFAELRQEIHAGFAAMRVEFKTEIATVKADALKRRRSC